MKRNAASVRRFVVTAVLMAISTPFLFYGAWMSMEGIFTSALKWLSPHDEGRQKYDYFVERFEGGNAILVSWEGCILTDRRLHELHTAIDPTQSDAPLLHKEIFDRVFTGTSTLKQITKEPIDLPVPLAIDRLQGTLIGDDGRTTCLIAVLSEDGVRRRREALQSILDATEKIDNLAESDLRLAGPPVDAIAIDTESDRSVDVYSIPSAVVCFILCWWCLRSTIYTITILTIGAFGEVLMLGSLYYANVTMDAVLITLPPLVFVLTVSAGVHLVNYYYDELRRGGEEGAPARAMRNGWAPCTLAAVTTAIGLGSLLVSHIVPVRMFGLFAACGVLTTVTILFAVLPGVMERWPNATSRRLPRSNEDQSGSAWTRLSGGICRYPILITLAGLATLGAGFWGLSRIHTSIGIRNLFAAESRVMRDYTWMEEHVAKLIPLEVVVHFPAETDLKFINRMEIVERIQAKLDEYERVGGTMSLVTFSPRIPRGRRLRDVSARARLNSRLDAHRDQFIRAKYLFESDEGQDWRITSRVSGLGDADYETVLYDLQALVLPMIKDYHQQVPGLRASFTGAMPVVYRAQKTLLQDMFYSMLTAFILVWGVMILVLATRTQGSTVESSTGLQRIMAIPRFLYLGMLAMLPNLFPIVVIFGWMGWRRIPVDIGSMMTACVALGIAVDDTLHFLSWYRRELATGIDRVAAIRRCFGHCGKAMVQTTIICGLGLLVFAMSSFVPTGRFAWLMLALLTSALVADLVFLPAILASPLGRVFGAKTEAAESGADARESSVREAVRPASIVTQRVSEG